MTNETQINIPVSEILAQSKVFRLKSQINGVPKLQGVFTAKDEKGFPIDMTYDLASEHGFVIDWIEALTDALRQSVDKYHALLEEIEILDPDNFMSIKFVFYAMIKESEGDYFTDKAQNLYERMTGQ